MLVIFLVGNKNGVYNSKLELLYNNFLHSIKLSEHKIGITFNKDLWAENKTINVVYDLAAWPRNPINNFKFMNCLFGATNMIKNSDKKKYVYSGYGITFNSTNWWSFGNVLIFGVDDSSSSYVDKRKSKFLILGSDPAYGFNGNFGSLEKKFSIKFLVLNILYSSCEGGMFWVPQGSILVPLLFNIFLSELFFHNEGHWIFKLSKL